MNLDHEIACVEKPSSDLYAFKILKGPFAGTIYMYGKVNIKENLDLDQATLKFDFQIELAPPGFTIKELEENYKFKNYIGDVLAALIEESENKDVVYDDEWDEPSIEIFNEWLSEWSKITGIDKYNAYLTGAFCQNYFFNKNIDTKDVDVTLELKPEANIDYNELKYILEQAEEIGFQKKLLIDIYVVEDAFKFTDKIIMTGKDTLNKSDTETWHEDSNVIELIPGLYEIIEDSTDAHNKYLSKNYEVLSKKLILPNK